MRQLRDYQVRAVTDLYEHANRFAILPMGAGKTAIALHAITELLADGAIRHALILAPKRVAEITWPAEMKEWQGLLGGHDMKVASGPKYKRDLVLQRPSNVTVVGIDNLQWLCDALSVYRPDHEFFDLLVIDETSRLKNPQGKRLKALLKILPRFKNVWGLTGTPRPNSSMDLWAQATVVTQGKIGWERSFYKWRQSRFYPLDFNGYNWGPLPGADEKILAEFQPWAFRLDEADMPELPDLNEVIDWVELPPKVRAEYSRMKRQLVAQLKDQARDRPDTAVGDELILAASAGVAAGKLAQLAQGFMYDEDKQAIAVHTLKLDWLEDLVETLDGEPLIVFYEFQEDMEQLRAAFPEMEFLADSKTVGYATQLVERWNAGLVPLFALHAASAGHGLNLQFGGHRMAWYGLTWSAELYDQAVKRLHRPGQAHKVTVHHCLARDTVDEMKRDRVMLKMSAQEAFRRFLATV